MWTILIFLFISALYVIPLLINKKWPKILLVYWLIGAACAAFSLTGSLAHEAHHNFTAHMLVHLLLGMIAPLFFVLAKPIALLVRTLPTIVARRLMRFFKLPYIRLIGHPITASLLNMGGLWLLYTTDLYGMMHTSAVIHYVIHLHIFLAGYLFTQVILAVDFYPQRASWQMRAIVLILAIAAHNILAKWIYANPLEMFHPQQVEAGAMWMYYGGGIVEIAIIILLCYEQYRTAQKGAKRTVEVAL